MIGDDDHDEVAIGNAIRALRSRIVEEARRWVGTPYHHQARGPVQVGADCIGLVFGVGIAAGVLPFDERRWRPFANYSRLPNPKVMRRALETFFVEIDEGAAGVGDIAWLGWRPELPMHLAILAAVADVPDHALSAEWGHLIVSERATMIHATGDIGETVEHGFVEPWPGRVVGWWRYPALAEIARGGV